MTQPFRHRVVIASGGTGGHFFPGLAVAEQLALAGCELRLLVSRKKIDQEMSRSAGSISLESLPSVGLEKRRKLAFLRGFLSSYLACEKLFRTWRPHAVLGMGGFSSAAPILCGKAFGAETFIHESNSIPGRANRFLAYFVDRTFVGFPQAAVKLHHRDLICTGTPVRPQFEPVDPRGARQALGLKPDAPVLLIMGGSQGAQGLNLQVAEVLTRIWKDFSHWQILHLTGTSDENRMRALYQSRGLPVSTIGFLSEMELALGAATLAVSRAGASSISELAAMRVPSLLVPFPGAANDHQYYNARALVDTGAAELISQNASLDAWNQQLSRLMSNATLRQSLQERIQPWHVPDAAEKVARAIIEQLSVTGSRDNHSPERSRAASPSAPGRQLLALEKA